MIIDASYNKLSDTKDFNSYINLKKLILNNNNISIFFIINL